MTLDELALRVSGAPPQLTVPLWAVGTVHRQSITFATGVCDRRTRVRWVQTHSMTGDIRIHPARPSLKAGDRIEDCDLETLILLASVEGGTADTAWDGHVMSWTNWVGFQTYDKYPEAGAMYRVGDCMIEFAPSGIYVEDWRFQSSDPGSVVGLRLVGEVGADGVEYRRSGGLVMTGDHVMQSIARRDALADGVRAQDFVKSSTSPTSALQRVFDSTVDYAVRGPVGFEIEASTDPRREGLRAEFSAGFEVSSKPRRLRQTVTCNGVRVERVWDVVSIEPNVVFSLSTTASAERLAWLAAEADTLLDPLSTPMTD